MEKNQDFESKEKSKKPTIFIIVFFLILIIIGVFFLFTKTKERKKVNVNISPTPILPEADPNIKVDLKPLEPGKTILLSISNYPDDIYSIEYELRYQSTLKPEGIFGIINLQKNEKNITRELTLGTCSSGKCVYHTLVGNKGILTIKFNAKSGASRFQKEFVLL